MIILPSSVGHLLQILKCVCVWCFSVFVCVYVCTFVVCQFVWCVFVCGVFVWGWCVNVCMAGVWVCVYVCVCEGGVCMCVVCQFVWCVCACIWKSYHVWFIWKGSTILTHSLQYLYLFLVETVQFLSVLILLCLILMLSSLSTCIFHLHHISCKCHQT